MDSEGFPSIDATPEGAAELLHGELTGAAAALEDGDLHKSVDGFVRALGLGLQLGPAPTERVLAAILQALRQSVAGGTVPNAAQTFSTLGPAVVGLVADVQKQGVLPDTPVMGAWATLASELGILIGQLGLALGIPAKHRADMIDRALTRALLLEDATGGRFGLVTWSEDVGGTSD